ncbi:hypothetical protein AMJ52_09290 [candidate division TA06 bacterium DG_78]|uniref:Bacterial transcriptional activator domain-containing protein n=1 Tax=candidate division TA06 bacterium DG_78 TaxID=1703772 RepID=A0A0S7Y8D2_UNCT6|nr:MAG: hypothetical protein AMJ52_09290 [candidate division TA06 bacterium DG_78]
MNKKSDNTALAEVLKAHASLLLEGESRHKDALRIIRKALRICPRGNDELRIEILITIGRLWRRIWDFKRAKPHLLKAYRIAERIKDINKMITIANNLALQFVTQGELRKAFKTFKRLIEQNKDNYWADVGIIFNNAVTNALALGKVEWAEQCLEKGWALCAPHEDLRSKIAIHRAFGALYMQKAQWDLAEQHLLKAQDMAAKMNWTLMEFFLYRTINRFYRYRGDMNKAEKYLNMMWQRLDKRDSPNEATFLTEMGCLYIACEQFEKADKVIETSSELIKKYGLNVLKFYSLLMRAAIALVQLEDQQALNLLRQAFRMAKVKGYDGLLINELWHNPRLAQFAQKSNIERNYIVSLNVPKDMPKLSIKVKCFGGLELQDKRSRTISLIWPTEKARSLFAFLVMHRRAPIRREVVMAQLWPDLAKKRAIQNFRTTASRMRQSLAKSLSGKLSQKEIFIWEHGKYQLFPGVHVTVDTEEFNMLLTESEMAGSREEKAHIVHQALELYEGDFLPEIYDAWTDVIRLRLRERRLSTLRWLAEYFAQRGDDLGCVRVCETYLTADSLSEEVIRLCMKSLSKLGQVTTVKARFKSLRQGLRRELNCTPSKETEDLYHSILKLHSKQ